MNEPAINHIHKIATMDGLSRFISSYYSICGLAADQNNIEIALQAICMLLKSPVQCIEIILNLIEEGAEACMKYMQENFMNIDFLMVNVTIETVEGNIKHNDLFFRVNVNSDGSYILFIWLICETLKKIVWKF